MFFYEGCQCPVCGKSFQESDDIVVCPQCGAPHHRECWKQEDTATTKIPTAADSNGNGRNPSPLSCRRSGPSFAERGGKTMPSLRLAQSSICGILLPLRAGASLGGLEQSAPALQRRNRLPHTSSRRRLWGIYPFPYAYGGSLWRRIPSGNDRGYPGGGMAVLHRRQYRVLSAPLQTHRSGEEGFLELARFFSSPPTG